MPHHQPSAQSLQKIAVPEDKAQTMFPEQIAAQSWGALVPKKKCDEEARDFCSNSGLQIR